MPESSNQPKPPSGEPSIRVVMMPRDTNALGTIFGGVIGVLVAIVQAFTS